MGRLCIQRSSSAKSQNWEVETICLYVYMEVPEMVYLHIIDFDRTRVFHVETIQLLGIAPCMGTTMYVCLWRCGWTCLIIGQVLLAGCPEFQWAKWIIGFWRLRQRQWPSPSTNALKFIHCLAISICDHQYLSRNGHRNSGFSAKNPCLLHVLPYFCKRWPEDILQLWRMMLTRHQLRDSDLE